MSNRFASSSHRLRESLRESVAARSGFSFIELLVVVAVIGILVTLLLPAVQAVREAARRSTCSKNLAQLILAIHNYHSAHGVYPPGTIESQGPIRNVPGGYHHNWIVQILPFLEERNVWNAVDPTVSVYALANAPVASLRLKLLECPSQPRPTAPQSCYAGVHHDLEAPIDEDNHGVFFLNSRVRYEDVTDGSSHTLFVGEVLLERGGMGWMSGTRGTLRNGGFGVNWPGTRGIGLLTTKDAIDVRIDLLRKDRPGQVISDRSLIVGGFGSMHPGGGQFALGDGAVNFLAETTDLQVMRLLSHRSDGKLLDARY